MNLSIENAKVLLDIINSKLKYPSDEELLKALSSAKEMTEIFEGIPSYELAANDFRYKINNWMECANHRGLEFAKFDYEELDEIRKNNIIVLMLTANYLPTIGELKTFLDVGSIFEAFLRNLKGYGLAYNHCKMIMSVWRHYAQINLDIDIKFLNQNYDYFDK